MLGVVALNAQNAPGTGARLAIRSGIVEVQRGNVWQPVMAGESLNAGQRIRTGRGSMASLEIGPDKMVTLNEQSEVQVGAGPIVRLESGSMKVLSASAILIATKDAVLEPAIVPLDLELGYEADRLNLSVFSGAVRNGSMIIRGGNPDPSVRTYSAGRMFPRRNDFEREREWPTVYANPNFMFGNSDPTAGAIVPPTVNNPTHPAYRPTQIVPPMSDPLRVPVMPQPPPDRSRR